MPYCWNRTTTWVQRLLVGLDYRDYTVRLNRQIGCCSEAYRLFVNNQEMEDHKLTYNPFSPLCGSGGQFEFEQDGHTFLVMFDSYSWTKMFGEFRLFIDGIDVNSGLEYSAFWRRRGWQIIALATFLLFLGIVVIFILPFSVLGRTARLARIARPGLAVAAIIYFVMGITVILRHRRPRKSSVAAVELPHTF